MLNFWATWCPPCRQEMPSMQELYEKTKNEDFVIIAISVDHTKTSEVKDFVKENNYTFPIFHDADETLGKKFLVRSIPTTLLIDKNGIIQERVVGGKDWSNLDPIGLEKVWK